MLIRIVRMHFKPEGIDEFLRVFNESKINIRNFKGCSHLQLLKDYSDPHTYTTLSYWNDEQCLNRYRQSDLFKNVWGKTRALFAKLAEAFSLEQFIEL